jgi:cytochrome c-type biogenesis protein
MLMYAGTTDRLADGVTLLAFYSIGLGLPLFASAMGMELFLSSYKRIHRYMGVMSSTSGVFLVVFGLAIYSDSLTLMTSFLERYGIGSYLGTDGR